MPTSPATTAFDGLTYNSRRPDIAIPEYGRVVHDMVAHCITIEDREERSKCAAAIVSARTPCPAPRNDDHEVLWGHLHVMANWELDIDGPSRCPPSPRRTRVRNPHLHPIGKRPSLYGRIVDI